MGSPEYLASHFTRYFTLDDLATRLVLRLIVELPRMPPPVATARRSPQALRPGGRDPIIPGPQELKPAGETIGMCGGPLARLRPMSELDQGGTNGGGVNRLAEGVEQRR